MNKQSNTFGLRVALLEDDAAQAELMKSWLEDNDFKCHLYADGNQLIRAAKTESFDVMVLDWEVPGMSGIEVVKHVRESLDWPIPVVFTTNRDSEQDIVTALEAGADDYLIKPVRKAELFARLNAVQRRTSSAEQKSQLVEYPPYEMNPATNEVNIFDKTVQLTSKEFDLAMYLFQHRGRVLSRGHILESVWGQRADLNTRTVDTHMSILRQKLGLRPQNGWRLSTIYRHGYRLEQIEEKAMVD